MMYLVISVSVDQGRGVMDRCGVGGTMMRTWLSKSSHLETRRAGSEKQRFTTHVCSDMREFWDTTPQI